MVGVLYCVASNVAGAASEPRFDGPAAPHAWKQERPCRRPAELARACRRGPHRM